MDQPPELTHDHFEILVTRELRKVGLELADVRRHRRAQLAEPDKGYLLELEGQLSRGPWRRRALIACRRQGGPLGRPGIDSLVEHVREAKAEVGLLFAAADVTAEALEAAQGAGVALFRVVDARVAYDTGGWGAPGHYPAWLPAYLAQLAERGVAGQLRYTLLEAKQADTVLGLLRSQAGVREGGPAA